MTDRQERERADRLRDRVATLENENAELWRCLRLAKAQRDRAIAQVIHERGGGRWHPDMEGEYHFE